VSQAKEHDYDFNSLFGGSIMSPIPPPYRVFARLRAERPVLRMKGWMDDSHLVTHYDDVVAGMKDSETFSARGNARGIGIVIGRTILEMEGAEHLRHRRILTPFFSLRALRNNVEKYIEATTHELIDQFVRDGRADLVPQFTFTYPLRVIAHMVGVPIADFETFHHWALALVSVADDPVKAFAAAKSIVDYLRPILEERREKPRDDLMSTLLKAEVEGERLTEEEVLSFLRLLLPAGAETTYRLTGNVLFALLTHPEQRAEVEANLELLPAFIEETLRWDSPVQLVSREATRDVELHGYRIPKGDLVAFSIGSANRDEHQFEDPDRFDLHRANKGDHVSFGLGEHFCLGSHLSRMEARIAAAAMLERLPNLRLDPAQECSIRGFAFRSPDRLPVLFG
jgi:cytochrome P450